MANPQFSTTLLADFAAAQAANASLAPAILWLQNNTPLGLSLSALQVWIALKTASTAASPNAFTFTYNGVSVP